MRFFIFFCILAGSLSVGAFVPQHAGPKAGSNTSSLLGMGWFDGISKAFSNEEFSAPPEGVKASARHILVKDEGQIDLVINEIQSGVSFNQVAQAFSTCPSASSGGSLGSFPPGRMVKEFDDVIFNPDTAIGELVGPVKTQFGWHMIVVDKRTGV